MTKEYVQKVEGGVPPGGHPGFPKGGSWRPNCNPNPAAGTPT